MENIIVAEQGMLAVMEDSGTISVERLDENSFVIMPKETDDNWMELIAIEEKDKYIISTSFMQRQSLLEAAINPEDFEARNVAIVKEILDELSEINENAVFELIRIFEANQGILDRSISFGSSIQLINKLGEEIIQLCQKYEFEYIVQILGNMSKEEIESFLDADNVINEFEKQILQEDDD